MSYLGGALSGIAGAALVNTAYDNLGDIGDDAYAGAQQFADDALANSQFQPYTVTTGSGSMTAGPNGTSMSLNSTGQAFQNSMQQQAQALGQPNAYAQQLGTGGQNMLQQGQDMLGNLNNPNREQEVYDRIRAMQAPGEANAQMQLDNQLASQGRLGVRTAAYGGTPEQLAQAKAVAEARNSAGFQAIQQSQQEQMQQYQMGMGMQQNAMGMMQGGQGMNAQQQAMQLAAMQGSYIPQSAMLDSMQPGMTMAGMAQQGQLQGAALSNETNMAGLEAMLGAGLGQANLIGNVGSGLLSGAANALMGNTTGGLTLEDLLGL